MSVKEFVIFGDTGQQGRAVINDLLTLFLLQSKNNKGITKLIPPLGKR
jgi:hypothetical protein